MTLSLPQSGDVAPGGLRGETIPGLVSVVMATYNCAEYLGPAVQSVLAQTYRDLELHIVDDGSTDATAETVARFREDPRVRYHWQPNAGQTAAKNHGIREARGEFIAFCDADDMWMPHKLATQIPRFATDARLGVVYSRTALMNEHGERIESDHSDQPRYVSGRVTSELFKLNFVPFGTAVLRRRCLQDLGPFDERYKMGIDWELWLRISIDYLFEFVDDETYIYRVWPGQMSRNWRGRYDHAFRIMREFLAHHPGVVAPQTVREAWAHCYAQRARLRLFISGEYGHALQDIARAIWIKPTYTVAWRMLPVVVLAATGARRS